MTVIEVMDCCTSPVWITLDEDSRSGEIAIAVEDTLDAMDILSDWILNHKVHLMHCEGDKLIISLFAANDARVDARSEDENHGK